MQNLNITKSKEQYSLFEFDKDNETYSFEYVSELGHIHCIEGGFSYDFTDEAPEDETGFRGSLDYEVDVDSMYLVDEFGNRRKIESFYYSAIIEETLKEALEEVHEAYEHDYGY